MNKIKSGFLISFILIPMLSIMGIDPADSLKYANWQNMDPALDKKMGVSVEKSYNELLKGKESKTIIVAVIDGGVDIDHEDLKEIIWINEDEIPDNGIDDDNNGYIDDIHGWNFIGNESGENINHATLEVTRLYGLYEDKYKNMDEDSIKSKNEIDYEFYQDVVNSFDADKKEAQDKLDYLNDFISDYSKYDSIIKSLTNKENYSIEDIKSLKTDKKTKNDTARKFMIAMKRRDIDKPYLLEYQEPYRNRIDYHYNSDFNARAIIGDNEYEWTGTPYGNKDVKGEDPSHGTMVSGIIGGVRNNKIGVNGIADNVKIMSVRTVPDGDEWDKDVANAIKYAIENGADVINMSFGKSFSPQKEFVDSIVRLVDENNVLLVHAAGNDGKNIDVGKNFPNKYSKQDELLANNWITVGASAISTKKKNFVARFSNYGKERVDVFAPGHKMLLCSPNNEYEIASGTSFAAPVVTGVATLIKSYYPNLSAAEIKEIILQTTDKKDYKVILPGTYGKSKQVVKFNSLSGTGGLVNIYNALLLAAEKANK